MIPEAALDSYRQATTGLAFRPRDDRGWTVVSGKDRASYLHGLFTNDITALGAGQGCYSAYLTAQGRMIADLWVYELGDVILLSMSREVKDTILAKLDQFIFSEDVQLGDVTASFGVTTVLGPQAPASLEKLIGTAAGSLALPEHGNVRGTFDGESAIVLCVSDYGVTAFDVLVDASRAAAFGAALEAAGAEPLLADAAEALRVEAGVPRFHRDMDEDTIPLEAGIESRAISLTKGCYVGQEVIIRVLHRGHGRVARKLVGLTFESSDPVPTVGASIRDTDRDIGAVTSSVWSPRLARPIALGYVHRDFLAPGTAVTVNGRPAVVESLPFADHST